MKLVPTYDVHDIVLYNHQGTLATAIIVKVMLMHDNILYEMDNSATLFEDDIMILLGNAKTIQEDYYGKRSDPNDLP